VRTKNRVSNPVNTGAERLKKDPYFTALLVTVRFRPGTKGFFLEITFIYKLIRLQNMPGAGARLNRRRRNFATMQTYQEVSLEYFIVPTYYTRLVQKPAFQ
jgi:hypothetical protein